MKALILAAGLGSRLGDITKSLPKALVKVAGEPMIKRVITKLKNIGITEFVINIHYLGGQIIDYLAENDNFGVNIKISDERDVLLDTGGGLLKAHEMLEGDEPIIIHNADILTDFDITQMLHHHIETNADATLLVYPRETSRYLLFDRDLRMVGWKNIKTDETRSPFSEDALSKSIPLAFGGVHIINPSIFPVLESFTKEQKFSITTFYTEMCGQLFITGHIPSEKFNWVDIGNPKTLSHAQNIASKLQRM